MIGARDRRRRARRVSASAAAGVAAILSAGAPRAVLGASAAFACLDSLAAEAVRPRSLSAWARLDSLRAARMAELADALLSGAVSSPPEAEARREQRVLLEGWLRGEPEMLRLLRGWSARAAAPWNGGGELTLPAAAILAAEGDALGALAWLEAGPIPAEDRAYAAVLAAESRLALGDTARAGEAARADLRALPGLPAWAAVPLERASIESRLASGDTARARQEIEAFGGRSDERGRWLLYRSRLARLRGRAEEADRLLWRVVEEYPGGPTARKVLRARIPERGAPPPELPPVRLRRLLRVAEEHGDLDRFRVIERGLRPALGRPGVDSLALRGGRLAFAGRRWDLLVALDSTREWFPETTGAVEWRLLTARAMRNSGRTDSMAARYAWVERRGNASERATACWEWAREMESLRRFAQADSLYARVLEIGAGDLRVQAILRRGICRFGLGDWAGARRRFEAAAAAGDAEDRAFARFWIYRAELAAGRPDSARVALEAAARGRAGYYGRRAEAALRLATTQAGPRLDDPRGFWRALAATEGSGADAEVRSGDPPLAAGSDWERDRLLLFRLCARTEWADRVRRRLEDSPRLSATGARAEAWRELGFPDLAARTAIRSGGPLRERFPLPYAGEVASAARRFRLAPEWLWAIMRRESIFESGVVSGAGAVGLLQLVEGTARVTAERHGLPAAPLRSPRVSVLLGAAHLRDLLEEEPGEWAVVLAAYNAGLPPARRWRQPGEDPDIYIERIGYRETREYVRRVLEGFWVYRELLRGE